MNEERKKKITFHKEEGTIVIEVYIKYRNSKINFWTLNLKERNREINSYIILSTRTVRHCKIYNLKFNHNLKEALSTHETIV
jgi:hypothetical protein